MPKRHSKTILATIFIIAIVTRIYNDPNIPFHYDPGKNIVYSRAILDSFPLFPQYNQYFNLGEYYEYQVLFPYIVALLHKITGISLESITSWSIIIIGSLLTITVYLISKEIFNNVKSALISAGLIAISKIQLFAYMNYYPQILAMTIMPLSFIFLIRYTRTLDKKYIIYISILSVTIILSSYLTGIVYLSILTLSLIIYSITRKELKWIYILISIIINSLGLATFYILPIIDRHGIETFITGIINTIFTKKDFPFTDVSIEIIIPNVFKFIFIILLIIGISLIIYLYNRKFRINLDNIKYEHIILFLWILIPLILVLSYKFRPILWVDRYIEFLDISITILAGYSIYLILNNIRQYSKNNYKMIWIILLVLIFSYPTCDIIRHGYEFGYWNMPSDLDTLNYIRENISSDSLFATPPGITSFWISALGGVHVLGGESSQILGKRFDGNSYSDTIINSPNIDEKMKLIREFGVNYIYLTIRSKVHLLWRNDYNVEGLKVFDNPRYFEFVYKKQEPFSITYVIKVKEDLTPKYNIPKTNKEITVLGYIISLVTLIIMIAVIIYDKNYR